MTMLFMTGLIMACLSSMTLQPIFALWLEEMNKFDVSAVSKFNAVDSTISAGMIGLFIQVHTSIIYMVDKMGTTSSIPIVNTLLLHGPLILILVFGLLIVTVLLPAEEGEQQQQTQLQTKSDENNIKNINKDGAANDNESSLC